MCSPIDRLADSLWATCVIPQAAADAATLERWQTDEQTRLLEGFLVKPLPAALDPLVVAALAHWREREQAVCTRLGMTGAQSLDTFERIIADHSGAGQDWPAMVQPLAVQIRGTVRNLDWVNLFSWVLPQADPARFWEHRAIGRMVSAIFYVERLARHEGAEGSGDLRKIEARWRLAAHA